MPVMDAPKTSVEALRLEAVLEAAAAGIIITDSEGLITSANPAAHRLFGYDSPELVGMPIEHLMPNPHRARHAQYMGNYMRTGETKIIGIGRELPALRKNGTIFPMHLSIGEYRADGARFFTGVVIDLSAQRDAEKHSRQQEALFRSIFESQTEAMVITDMEHVIQLTNPAFESVFAFPGSDVVAKSLKVLCASEEDFQTATDTTEGTNAVSQYRRGDGKNFPGSVVSSLIRDRGGNELGYIKSIRDISDDLRREAQLMQSQRMEAIGQLTGGIAHDFNNLLTVILGNLELLDGKLEGELPRTLANEAIDAAEMGARLTDRLLTFGRRQHLDKHQINLNEFVLNMIDILRRTIGEDIDLSTALTADIWATQADPTQVENSVLNLAINARDAMPRGGRIVIETRNVILDRDAVATYPELSPGDYVALSVSDTGQGMDEATRARAFEPFFTTKGTGKGSGLGLATIYGFVKQTNGHVSIYSEIDRGTIVTLYLPRCGSCEEQEDASADPGVDLTGNGETILVVEDEERVRRLTAKRLIDLGYRVLEAGNGPEAMNLMNTKSAIDLVFTDVVMPGGMSGLDLQHEIAARFPHIKVVLTSGYAEEFVSNARHGSWPLWLLRKPYRQAELASMLKKALLEQSSGAA